MKIHIDSVEAAKLLNDRDVLEVVIRKAGKAFEGVEVVFFVRPTVLSQTHCDLLSAMFVLGAFSEATSQTKKDIYKKAGFKDPSRAWKYLVDSKLVISKQGGEGSWLTMIGQGIASSL